MAEHDNLDGQLLLPTPREPEQLDQTDEDQVEEEERHIPSSASVSANERPGRTAWMGLSAPTGSRGRARNDEQAGMTMRQAVEGVHPARAV